MLRSRGADNSWSARSNGARCEQAALTGAMRLARALLHALPLPMRLILQLILRCAFLSAVKRARQQRRKEEEELEDSFASLLFPLLWSI